ncbi:hypothetical protein LPJ53_003624 [Coemansia erecta]|uniref:Aldehyde dehydrogenase domain-containing protein n=1 Tax=Coemansia erecta TaxID=147472 RepID=A0A9W7XVW1_9FUNG|nr:hypothetical protein LPJ53_003624 [Coemansia erecta]
MTTSDTKLVLPTRIDDVHVQNFINGQWVPPSTGAYLKNVSPLTGKDISPLPDSDSVDIDIAVSAAKDAFPKWSTTPADKRAAILLKISELIKENIPLLSEFESLDQGKPLRLAMMHEMPPCVYLFAQFADIITKGIAETSQTTPFIHTPASIMDPKPCKIEFTTQHVPAGVAAIITPWNVPLEMICIKLAPCLAAGNTCVIKPTELTSINAYMLTHILKAAGVPDGVVNVVFGTGPRAGEPLVKHKDVRLVSFTGGTKTGFRIGGLAGGMGKRVALELGGKNPNLVFDDCDIDHAVATGIRSAFHNQGEICLCASRHYVQQGIYAKYVEMFREMAQTQLKVGDPKAPDTYFSAVVSQNHMDKITRYIRLAQEEGATVEFLVKRDDPKIKHISSDGRLTIEGFEGGFFVAPTLITNISQKSRVMQEEIFGPVVCVLPFEDEDEGVALANDTEYGLGASVWSLDKEKLDRVMGRINAGTVWGNAWFALSFSMPFGGMKNSGNMREFGTWGMEFFTETKTLSKHVYAEKPVSS